MSIPFAVIDAVTAPSSKVVDVRGCASALARRRPIKTEHSSEIALQVIKISGCIEQFLTTIIMLLSHSLSVSVSSILVQPLQPRMVQFGLHSP